MTPVEMRELASTYEQRAELAPAFADTWNARARSLRARADELELTTAREFTGALVASIWGPGGNN